MDKTQVLNIEKNILDLLEMDFYEMDMDIDRTDASEYGIEEVLSFEFGDDILASYYFMPVTEEYPTEHYFVQSVKVFDEVRDIRKKLEMLRAINLLNYNIPYGCFVFDQDIDVLTYRYTIPMGLELDADAAESIIFNESYIGLGIVNTFAEPLKAYMEDLVSWDGFVEKITEAM